MFHTLILKSASWIDTSSDTTVELTYLQTLFDIEEIYTRQWRMDFYNSSGSGKSLRETQIKAIAAALARQEKYNAEIFGAKGVEIQIIQKKWDGDVHTELLSLREYAAEKPRF